MNKLYLLIFAVAFSFSTSAQNLILNGSFENNSAVGDMQGLTYTWSNYVSDSWEIDGGTMDLVTSYNCGDASDGYWFVTTCSSCGTWPYIAFSLKFITPLTAGDEYTVSFDKEFCINSSAIDIGISNDSTLLGTFVHTFDAPLTQTWVHDTYTFQAPIGAKYLTVNVGVLGGTGLIALDNFSLEAGAVGIKELSLRDLRVFPNPTEKDFQVTFTSKQSSTAILEIKNVLGETEIQKDIFISAGENKITIENLELEKGMYFIQLYNTDIKLAQKLIIQ